MDTKSSKRRIPKVPVRTPLGIFLWGEERFNRRVSILEALQSNPIFSKDNVVYPSIARKDAWTRIAHQSQEFIRLKLKHGWSNTQFMEAIRMMDNYMPVHPQFRIFMSNLERQMSDEQKQIWIPRAERFEIFGSYAQTELGHGSNVRDLETTATFDEERDEFIIDSPTLSSTKYWIGATGVWATHSIVVAKLIVKGNNYGNHLFLTQIRDLDSHRLMPGCEIYELGPKAFQGMLGTDNGAMQFHKVRVPRSQMLARNAQVLRDGTYVKPENEKHSYGSMVTVRALMAEITGWDLLQAVVVAYHYTTFRQQFRKDAKQTQETTVFDYSSVRYRLLPLLAQATALIVVGRNTKRAYDEYTANYLKTGDFSALEDFHLQTVGAKVYSTEITGHGIETCRIACGGHGYNALSGFGRMYANAINAVTYEGDNYVVGKQVPRAILKHYRNKTYASLPTLSYLSILDGNKSRASPQIISADDWSSVETQRWALEQRLSNLVQQHIEDTDAGKDTSYSSHALTMAHCDFVYWRSLQDVVRRLEEAKESYAPAMKTLAEVFSLSIIEIPHHPSLAQALPLDLKQQKCLRDAFDTALEQFASKHVAEIVDAYGLTEYEMDSALAKSDKTPYEALEEGAKRSEMSGDGMSHLFPMIASTHRIAAEIDRQRTGSKL